MEEKVKSILQKAIEEKNIPGAAIQISFKGKSILEEAFGNRIDFNDERAAMKIDTIFDLASLTKVVATLPAILKLVDEGMLSLSDSVANFIPEFAVNNKEDVKIFHLLTHTSGLINERKFYRKGLNKEEIYNEIYQEKLVYNTGEKVMYSDLGFMLLSRIIEIVSKMEFDKYVQENIFIPLEMHETSFLPKFSEERFAASEYNEQIQTYKIGVVHDSNAHIMGGVSGHAGLFSSLVDLQKYVAMIRSKGIHNNEVILSRNAIELMKRNFTMFSKEHRGLGWQLQALDASCGDYFSASSFGHTGFTGTSIWIDPDIDLSVILLTNRVHYGRNPNINILRPRLHNVIRKYF